MSIETPDFNTPEQGPEITEEEASEILQSGQALSPEEQERLVGLIEDPNLSMYALTINNENLTRPQMERLLGQVLSDPEASEILYINLTESGIELNENETWWMEELKKVLE